jgi:hypothetical protein
MAAISMDANTGRRTQISASFCMIEFRPIPRLRCD